MARFTPITISAGYGSTSSWNTNFTNIQTATNDGLSRTETSSNSMSVRLDMNGYEIINVSAPSSGSSAARWADVTSAISLTGTAVPSLSGSAYKFLTNDGTNLSWGLTIKDANGNKLLDWTTVASAVNYLNISNTATGAAPILNTAGSDTNIGMELRTKGTGKFIFNNSLNQQALTVTSAAPDIGTSNGDVISISGTTTITAFGTITIGAIRYVTFEGALTLTHNATSLILPGAANITTAAGDSAVMKSLGSGNWRCLVYTKASGVAVIASTFVAPTTQIFLSGAGTYTTPANVKYIRVKVIGGGGGGSGSCDATNNGGTGGTGGTSTFGTALLTSVGGTGGTYNSIGGAGGSATAAAPAVGIAIVGGRGTANQTSSALVATTGHCGAVSPFGGAGHGGGPNAVAGGAAVSNSGSGGGGAGGPTTGGGGSAGGAAGYIEVLISTLSATYSYAIGAAGAAGAAGTAGAAGGAGGSGYIIVEEYYA